MSKRGKVRETFETTIAVWPQRTMLGSYYGLRRNAVSILKFKPGDIVRVTVTRIERKENRRG